MSELEKDLENMLEEIKKMLRHLNNEVQIVKMEQHKEWHRFTGLVFSLGDRGILSDDQVINIVNIDPSVDTSQLYRPIDGPDKDEWEEYLKKEHE